MELNKLLSSPEFISVLDKLLRRPDYITLSEEIRDTEKAKQIARFLKSLGFRVDGENRAVYVEGNSVKNLISLLIDAGYITRESVLSNDVVGLPARLRLRELIAAHEDLATKLGVTKQEILEATLSLKGVTREALLKAGFTEEPRLGGRVLRYVREDSDGFVHKVEVKPSCVSGKTCKVYDLPLVGRTIISRDIAVGRGEDLNSVLEKNKKEIEEEASALSKIYRTFAKLEDKYSVRFSDIAIEETESEKRVVKGYIFFDDTLCRPFIFPFEKLEDFETKIAKMLSEKPLSAEVKREIALRLLEGEYVNPLKIAEEYGVNAKEVLKFIKSCGARKDTVDHQSYYLSNRKQVKKLITRVLEEEIISPEELAFYSAKCWNVYSRSLYDALCEKDPVKALIYKINTYSNLLLVALEVKKMWNKTRNTNLVVELIRRLESSECEITEAEEQKVQKVLSDIIKDMNKEEFNKTLCEVPSFAGLKWLFGEKLGEVTGLGRPDNIVIKTFTWNMGKYTLSLCPFTELVGEAREGAPQAPAKKYCYKMLAVSNKYRKICFTKVFYTIPEVGEELLAEIEEELKKREENFEKAARAYAKDICEKIEALGLPVEVEEKWYEDGLVLEMRGVGSCLIAPKAGGVELYFSAPEFFGRREVSVPTLLEILRQKVDEAEQTEHERESVYV